MFKPMSVTIGTDATLILPAVAPKPADVLEFDTETEMELAVGDIVETSAGLRYWCVAAGTAALVEPSHADGDAACGDATLRKHHARREYLAIANLGAVALTLGLGDPAVAGKGIVLNAGGGTVEFKRGDGPVPQGKITAIVASGTTDVGIQEG
jgi:hypothetical protein